MSFTRIVPWAALGLLLTLAAAPAGAANPCEAAGAQAERDFNLPAGLLAAIGQVESGVWDHIRSRLVAWPWTIDVAGAGQQFASAADAVRATQFLRDGGARNIDVGCFQVSLLYHPDAFKDLHEAFDPTANAQYAARLLTSLNARLGSWQAAVAAYHSADPARGMPYQRRVFARWQGTPIPAEASAAPAPLPFGIHIWTPSPPGEAASLIQVSGARPMVLPRVSSPATVAGLLIAADRRPALESRRLAAPVPRVGSAFQPAGRPDDATAPTAD